MAKDRQSRQAAQERFDILNHENGEAAIQHLSATTLPRIDDIDDPRTRHITYPLREILFVAAIATLCGADSNEKFATFGRIQIEWFRQFISLDNGVPSHDTFRRIFELLKPNTLNDICNEIFNGLNNDQHGNHIAIDGKMSRGCYQVKGQSLLNMVSAYDTEHGISLAHVSTTNDEGKAEGEFNAIPKLIAQLNIKDTLITIDAGGCYTEIVDAILDGGGSYAITLKENQPTLYKKAEAIFEEQERNDFADVAAYCQKDRGHGRVEERMYYAVPAPVDDERLSKWSGLTSLVMGRFRREVKGEEATETTRYYMSSLSCTEVVRLGQSLRGHWGIENGLHWVLDVSFGEDANRTREGKGAENLSLLRRRALGMLRQVKGKQTVPTTMFRAAIDPAFRTEIVKKFLMR
jgi:predicted transposase YbfD/YdcC